MKKKTYNFIEAVNSGKRFRPVNWSDSIDGKEWYSWSIEGLALLNKSTLTSDEALITKDILNQKYILEEKTITITESKFDDALSFAIPWSRESLKKELGF